MAKPCAVPACGRTVPREVLMCLRHWRQVPLSIRREVLRTGAGAAWDSHDEAKRRAIEAVLLGGGL